MSNYTLYASPSEALDRNVCKQLKRLSAKHSYITNLKDKNPSFTYLLCICRNDIRKARLQIPSGVQCPCAPNRPYSLMCSGAIAKALLTAIGNFAAVHKIVWPKAPLEHLVERTTYDSTFNGGLGMALVTVIGSVAVIRDNALTNLNAFLRTMFICS